MFFEKFGISRIQNRLTSKLSNLLEDVVKDRNRDPQNSQYSIADHDKIIKEYMMKNVAIATASSLIPGPAGMLAAIPSILNSISNQMKVTYDIACSYGKEDLVVKDLLIDVPLQAMGVPTGLSKIQHFDKLEEVNMNQLNQKIKGFGTSVAKKKLQGAITSLVPGMGTVFAITQAKMETAKVITTSTSFFNPEEILHDPILDTLITEEQKVDEQIKILINLMTLDSKSSKEEINFIKPIIKGSPLTKDKKKEYFDALNDEKTDYTIDYDLLKKSGDAEEVILDLAVLTKRDGDIGPRELEYVRYAAEKLQVQPLVYKSILE